MKFLSQTIMILGFIVICTPAATVAWNDAAYAEFEYYFEERNQYNDWTGRFENVCGNETFSLIERYMRSKSIKTLNAHQQSKMVSMLRKLDLELNGFILKGEYEYNAILNINECEHIITSCKVHQEAIDRFIRLQVAFRKKMLDDGIIG